MSNNVSDPYTTQNNGKKNYAYISEQNLKQETNEANQKRTTLTDKINLLEKKSSQIIKKMALDKIKKNAVHGVIHEIFNEIVNKIEGAMFNSLDKSSTNIENKVNQESQGGNKIEQKSLK